MSELEETALSEVQPPHFTKKSMEPREGKWLSQDDIDIRGLSPWPLARQDSGIFTKVFL